jgi:hypothetical protein
LFGSKMMIISSNYLDYRSFIRLLLTRLV